MLAYLAMHPVEIVVRLDWSDSALRATISGRPAGANESAESRARAVVAAARRDRSMPAALATMIHEQESETAARNAGLPESVLAEIEQRAAPLGLRVTVSDDRWQIELLSAAKA